MNKRSSRLSLTKLSLLAIFIFLFFPFISSTTYPLDSDAWYLKTGVYNYTFDLSAYYDWAEGELGYGLSSSSSTHRVKITSCAFGGTYVYDYIYLDGYYCYYAIPMNSSYFTLYACGDEWTIQTGISDFSGCVLGVNQTKIEVQRKISGSWPSADYEEVFQIDPIDQDTHYSLPSTSSSFNITSDLLHFYPLNQASLPLIDNTYNLNLTHAIATPAYNTSGGLTFNSNGDFVYVNNSDGSMNFSSTQDFTFNFWVNRTASFDDSRLFKSNTGDTGVLCQIDNSSSLVCWVGNGTWQYGAVADASGFIVNNADFSMYTLMRNNSGQDLWLYKNAELIDSDRGHVALSSLSARFILGDIRQDRYSGVTYKDFSVYNKSLTPSQISLLYTSSGSSSGGVVKLSDISNQTMGYYDNSTLNISAFFSNWYDWAVLYDEPITSTQTGLITCYESVYSDYFDIQVCGDIGGDYDSLVLTSYGKNQTIPVDVFACSNESIDSWCPTIGFPSTCNFSRFYTDDSCEQTSFFFNIVGYYNPSVTRDDPFMLYYYLEEDEYQGFSMNNYFLDYTNISVTYYDPVDLANYTLNCSLGSSSIYSSSSFLYVNLTCTSWGVDLGVIGSAQTGASTFWVTAANINNSLSDYFLIATGDYSVPVTDSELEETKIFNFSDFKDFFPEPSDTRSAKWIAFFVIGAFLFFGIMLVGIPLKFNKFSLIIIFILFEIGSLFMALNGYCPWSWAIIPPVSLFVLYVGKSLIGGGS